MITITARQNEYLEELRSGPKTTHDMVLSQMVTGNSVSKAMSALREVGLVISSPIKGTRGRRYAHCLSDDFDAMEIKVVSFGRGARRSPVAGKNIECVIDLRNEGFTQQQLCSEFRKRTGEDRTDASIKNIVNNARRHPEWK